MKVLQITTHMDIGGIANYILSLSGALKAKGIETVVASSGGNLEKELAKKGIAHIRLDIKTKSELSPKVLKSAFAVRGLIKDERIDIVHAHTRVSQVAAYLASRMAKVPYVTTCHGFFKKRLRRVFDTWGDKVIAISAAVRQHLETDLGVEPGRVALIYSGVDIGRFARGFSPEERLRIKKEMGLKDGPVIGTIGRLSDIKGQRFLVEAMKDMLSKRGDIQCIIVGDGPEEGRLKSLAASLGLEGAVYFLRSAPQTQIFLAAMDVFILPSVKEGLGLALLEAFAAGKACVASDIGGISDIVKEGETGLLFPVGDARALSGLVLRLVEDAALRARLGASARALAGRDFSLDMMAKRVADVYEEALKRHAKA
jgi:glycosyltransferase involved in cell wall biosynthesis